MRLGCVTTTRPATTPATAGGTKVVLPVPGGAWTTATPRVRSASTRAARPAVTGRSGGAASRLRSGSDTRAVCALDGIAAYLGQRGAAPYSTMPKFTSIEDYLASLPPDQRAVVKEIEQRVLTVVPGAERVIRYDMPTWQIDGTSLVHAAAWKQHVSLYPVPPEGDPSARRRPRAVCRGKGHVKLPYTDIDYDLVERVVRRLLESR